MAEPKKTAKPPKKKKEKGQRPPVRAAGVSTWIVGGPVILFLIVIAPANPALGVLGVGGLAMLTGLYTLILDRPSWARIQSRKGALAPILLAVILIVLSAYLPRSLIIAPRLLTALPVPTAEQSAALDQRLDDVDTRFTTNWEAATRLAKADDVCRNDFASQTPEQEIASIQEHLTFSHGDPLTAEQARGVLAAVRSTYCGEPGSRAEVVQSELAYSVPALWSFITEFAQSKHGADF